MVQRKTRAEELRFLMLVHANGRRKMQIKKGKEPRIDIGCSSRGESRQPGQGFCGRTGNEAKQAVVCPRNMFRSIPARGNWLPTAQEKGVLKN